MKKNVLIFVICLLLCAVLFGCNQKEAECSIVNSYKTNQTEYYRIKLFYKDIYFDSWMNGDGSIKVLYGFDPSSFEHEATLFGKAYVHISGDKVSGYSDNLFEPNSYVYFRVATSQHYETLFVKIVSSNNSNNTLAEYSLSLPIVTD